MNTSAQQQTLSIPLKGIKERFGFTTESGFAGFLRKAGIEPEFKNVEWAKNKVMHILSDDLALVDIIKEKHGVIKGRTLPRIELSDLVKQRDSQLPLFGQQEEVDEMPGYEDELPAYEEDISPTVQKWINHIDGIPYNKRITVKGEDIRSAEIAILTGKLKNEISPQMIEAGVVYHYIHSTKTQ